MANRAKAFESVGNIVTSNKVESLDRKGIQEPSTPRTDQAVEKRESAKPTQRATFSNLKCWNQEIGWNGRRGDETASSAQVRSEAEAALPSERFKIVRETPVTAGQTQDSIILRKGSQDIERGKIPDTLATRSIDHSRESASKESSAMPFTSEKPFSPPRDISAANSTRTAKDGPAVNSGMKSISQKPTTSDARTESAATTTVPPETTEKSSSGKAATNIAQELRQENPNAGFSSAPETATSEVIGERPASDSMTLRSSLLHTKIEQLQELRTLLGQVLKTSQPLRLDKGSGLQFLWMSQDWGPVQFIIGQHEQEVVARVQVQDANVKSLLETNHEGLQQIFSEQGLRLDRFEIEATRELRGFSIPEVRWDEHRRRQTRARELFVASPWDYEEETLVDFPVPERKPTERRVWIA
jgi:hypothetical protein